MKRWRAKITRDIVQKISMGALVVRAAKLGGIEQEIAPPRVMELAVPAGRVSQHKTRKDRDAYIAAVNAEHPGAAVPA